MNIKNFLKTLGPGLLWAGAAIGVSHLVQSTRAGAMYGFELWYVVILINLFKYPFFEFAPRYAIATGENLLQGYQRLGKWAIYLFLGLTLGTMFPLVAAVVTVTAGIFSQVFPSVFNDTFQWTLLILFLTAVFVGIGRYSTIDKLMKFIIILLTISTVAAVVAVFFGEELQSFQEKSFKWEFADIAFLIAFAGWMPTAIDVAVWHSMWTLAKKEEIGYTPTLKEALLDFNIGYIGTIVSALCFVLLGAYVMYNSGEVLSDSSTVFSGQVISMFTKSLGTWAYPLIAIAALTTMTSTVITVIDAFPRVLKYSTEIVAPPLKKIKPKVANIIWIIILLSGSIVILKFFSKEGFKVLVDFATTISFLTAPLLGYMNYKVITAKNVPLEAQPKLWLKILSWLGLIVLSGFSVYYILWKFFF